MHEHVPVTDPRPDLRPDLRPDRSGAVWVTATGALLLFAAAVTFVAVRWDDLASWQKFAALVAVTQLLLVGGWVGRRRVPATSAATWSLGVVLVPLDAWSIAASGNGTWQRGLFVGGLMSVLVVPLGRRWWDTSALRWATVLVVPLAVAGVAAVTGAVPTAVVVAGAGVVAGGLGLRTEGRAWLGLGLVAGFAVAAEPLLTRGDGVLAELGLTGSPWLAVAAGAVGLVGAVVDGSRHRRAEWVWVFGVAALADMVVGVARHGTTVSTAVLAVGTAFLVVELVGLSVVRDRFWSGIAGALSTIAEVAAGAASVAWVLADPIGTVERGWKLVVALVLGVLGWIVADLRATADHGRVRPWRRLFAGAPSTPASVAALVSVWLISRALPLGLAWQAALVLGVGALWLITNRAGSTVIGPVAVCWGALAIGFVGVGWSFVGLGALVVAVGVGAARRPTTAGAVTATVLGTFGLLAWGLGWSVTAALGSDRWLWLQLDSLALAFVVLGALAVSRGRSTWAAVPPWVVAPAVLGSVGVGLGERGFAPAASIATLLLAIGSWATLAIRGELVLPGVLAALTSPLLAAAVLDVAGLADAELGIGMAVVAFVLVGGALVAPRIIRPFLLGAAGAHLLAGTLACLEDPGALGVVLAMAGVLVAVVAVLESIDILAANGGLLALLGTWQALAGYGIATPEAYLAPLALLLAVAGWYVRRDRGVSSWMADTPAIAVLGMGALAVRIDGGAGWHAVVAGSVALVAVAVGGWRRLAGPLLGGSLLLAAVVVNETVRVTAGVPTWIWLALGGTTLLGAGVSMELHGLGPIESGRRLVEVIDERFE